MRVHGHMHRGKFIGIHRHVLKELKLDTIQQLHGLWELASLEKDKKGLKRIAQDVFDAYKSYFRDSKDASKIIAIFKDALELETGFTLK